MGKYTDYVMKTAQDLLAVPSPSGFTHMAAEFVKKEFENLGYKPQITQKGAVLVKLGGKDDKNAVVLADDSGLEIDYLNKEPGIYSARFIGEDISYDIKNQAILDLLAGVPKEERTARFVCSIAAVLPDGRELVTRETMEGYIGDKIAGENGFGYDPIFCVEKYGCTTAELSEEQKNEISHRGKALRAMKEKLAKENL